MKAKLLILLTAIGGSFGCLTLSVGILTPSVEDSAQCLVLTVLLFTVCVAGFAQLDRETL